MWLEGKGHGYFFPLPEAAQGRERERGESPTLPGRYEQVPGGAQ